MPIFYNEETKTFRLDAGNSSYAFFIDRRGYLEHLTYSAHISDTSLEQLAFVIPHASVHTHPADRDNCYFSSDFNRLEYSCSGYGDNRTTALAIRRSDTGTNDTDLRYVSHKIYAGKPMPKDLPATYADDTEADTLEILCRDAVSGAEVTLFYTAFRNLPVITRRATIRNAGKNILELERALSLSLDFQNLSDTDFIHLWGDWGAERSVERVPLMHGVQSVGSVRGSSSHMHNPFIALCDHMATETDGDVIGFNLVYSGNFLASTEVLSDFSGRVVMGVHPDGFRWRLEPDEVFETPECVMVHSSNGLGDMSRTYHKLYSNNLVRGKWKTERRPILINNWEATYFNFDEDKIFAIAEEASKLGIEMLVLDDGWFGHRDNDRSSLGDWYVDKKKLPNGLTNLVNRIHGLGMKFGIWFEPEMISPDSDLYRAHPDWAVQISGRPILTGRNQYILDMTNKSVRDYLFDRFRDILSQGGIDYIKWDFNRNYGECGSLNLDRNRQSEVMHRHYLGLYELLERLHNAYPDLLLEGCSGGGGRFDPAWLYYAPQIWTSDDSDAIERLGIQYGTSFCYPPSTMGSHVSAVPNHQVRRITPFKTRGDVALMGAFGYELDLRTLSDDEKELVKKQCELFKTDYDVTHFGDFYRLISPFGGSRDCAWEFVSEDKKRAILTYTVIRTSVQHSKFIKLAGLDPNVAYRCEETGDVYHGDTLMHAGYLVCKSIPTDFTSVHLHFVAINE